MARKPKAPATEPPLGIEEALTRAHADWAAGQAAQAERQCQNILAAWPGQCDALHLMGVMAHASGDLDRAIAHLRQSCQAPRAPAVYFSNLAEMCRQKGLLPEGEQAARRAVALDADLVPAWNNLGIILQEMGKLDESRICLERVVRLQPDYAEAHHNLGNTCTRLGLSEQAERHYAEARSLRQKPDDDLRQRPLRQKPADNLRQRLERQGRLSPGPRQASPGRIRLLAMTVAPDWLGIARLPASLSAAGFDVAVLCPRESYLAKTDFACERHFYQGDQCAEALAEVAAAWDPHLIIPGDEWNALLLHHMDSGDLPAPLRQLIRRSLGDPLFYGVVSDKVRLLAEASGLGIRVPPQAPVETLDAFAAGHGYPLVIKASMGMAGISVRVCDDRAAASAAIAELEAMDPLPFGNAPTLIVQKFIAGHAASISFVALEGRLLDHFIYRPEVTTPNHGPSSVVRRIDHSEIAQVARRLVERLGFTGFGGFDFMVEEGSGAAYLLEMNPRVPITGHLGAPFGHDLAGALHAGLAGTPLPPPTKGTDVVVLFPHEWWRNPASPHLRRHYVDMPWDDAGLLRYFVTLRL